MIKNNHQKTAFLLFIGVFLFSCNTYICSYTMPQFLLETGLTAVEENRIQVIEMLGYIIAGLILTPIISKINYNKATIVCQVILTICMTNIITLEGYDVLKFNFIIMSSAYYAYLILTIIKILEVLSDHRYFAVVIFSMSWIAGHFVAHLLESQISSALDSLMLCILFYVTIIVTCLFKENNHKVLSSVPKFSFLISNIELQVLTGFMITYITFDILWYYEEFALLKHLALSNSGTVLHYMLISIFLTIIPAVLVLRKINKYLANLVLIITLLVSFILIGKYGNNLTANILFLSIISISLSSISICNILILCDKFESEDLRSAITIYFTMSAIGMFAGALSSNSAEDSVDKQNLFFSTFAVVGTFAIYYLWYFIKRKLYRW